MILLLDVGRIVIKRLRFSRNNVCVSTQANSGHGDQGGYCAGPMMSSVPHINSFCPLCIVWYWLQMLWRLYKLWSYQKARVNLRPSVKMYESVTHQIKPGKSWAGGSVPNSTLFLTLYYWSKVVHYERNRWYLWHTLDIFSWGVCPCINTILHLF